MAPTSPLVPFSSALPGAIDPFGDLDRVPQAATLGLVWVDFPGFSEMASTLGIHAAHHVAVELGRRIDDAVDATATVCRVGISQLFVVLPDAGPETTHATANRLADRLGRPQRCGTAEVWSSVDIGVHHWVGDGVPRWQELLTVARRTATRSGETRIRDWAMAPMRTTPQRPQTRDTRRTPAPRSPDGLFVLVVEDNPGDVSLLRRQLDRKTFDPARVVVAESLAEAHTILDTTHVDCAVLDLGLPDAQGAQALHELRAAHPFLPIVVLTGRDDEELGRTLARAGAQDFLRKGTYSPSELNRSLAFAVERMRAVALDRRMSALMGGAEAMVMVLDGDHRVTYSSNALSMAVGRWNADLVGARLDDLFDDRDAAAIAERLDALDGDKSTGEPPIVTLARAQGGTRPLRISIEDMRREPSVRGVVVRLHDDSARLAAIAELQVERVLHETIATQSHEMVLFFEPGGVITWASGAARNLFGVDPSELIGLTGYELVDPADRDAVVQRLSAIPELGDSVTSEFRITLPSGETRWVEEIVTNFVDDPAIGVVVGNYRDVTERRHHEDEVRMKSDLLAAVGQPVMAVDAESRITYWNRAAEKTFGWSSEEVIGHPARHLVAHLSPSQAADATRALGSEGGTWTTDLAIATKDGGSVDVAVSATSVRTQGAYDGYIAVATDISDRVARERASAQLAAIVRASSDAIYSIGADRRILTWNEGAAKIFGYDEAQALGLDATVLAPAGHREEMDRLVDDVFAGREVKAFNTVRQRADGTTFDVAASLSPVHDPAGQVTSVAAVSRDISEHMDVVRSLGLRSQQLRDAQRTANLGSFEVDLITGEVTRSEELRRILGGLSEERKDVAWDFVHPDDVDLARSIYDRAVAGDHDAAIDYRIVRPDGEVRWVSTKWERTRQGTRPMIVGTVLDITTSKTYELELERLAFHDAMADLPNRAALTRDLAGILDDGVGGDQVWTVAMIDLDDFKVVNDSYGHSIGDELLRLLAIRLRSTITEGDLLFRFGSDQFVVLRKNSGDGRELASRVLGAIRRPCTVADHTLHVTASVGLASTTQASTPETVVRDADIALHAAKEAGRDRAVTFDDALRHALLDRQRLERGLRDALVEGGLRLVYQPVLALSTGQTIGFEALMRWDHPELGAVPPSRFIPLAERTGLIDALGSWTLRTALGQVTRWLEQAGPQHAPWVAVNLSAVQLRSPHLVTEVRSLLDEFGLPPDRLHLELTETAMMSDVEDSLERLGQLRELGVELDIDDFGTGYSSLSYLRRMPLSTLKIDRSFVDGLGSDAGDTAIARAIIGLARDLGMRVQAEGVETEQQLAVLESLGCDRAQGYLWSPGLDPDATDIWLTRGG
nr:EAL domain-containing protein [Rhabdothermincola salaria]